MENLDFDDFDKYLRKMKGKIIHQIWFGTIPNKKVAKKAFDSLRKYRDSWLIQNPSWTYVCWDLKRCKDLVKMFYPQHKEMYDKYPYQIQRCDVVRYFILHRYGGLYADMDYFCKRPWDEVVKNYQNDIYLVETPNKIYSNTHVSNSLMYSTPNHIFWSKLFIYLEQNQTAPIYYGKHLTIMFTTGPGILNRVFSDYRSRYHLDYYPYELFHPCGLNLDILSVKDNSNIYALHIGKGSWESHDSKILIFLYTEYYIITFTILTLVMPSFIFWLVSRINKQF